MARTLESGPSELRPLMLSWLWLPERSRTDGKKARVRAVRAAAPGCDDASDCLWKKEAEGGDGAHPPEDAVAAAAHGEELTRHGLGEGRGQVGRLTELAALDEEAAPQTAAVPASVRVATTDSTAQSSNGEEEHAHLRKRSSKPPPRRHTSPGGKGGRGGTETQSLLMPRERPAVGSARGGSSPRTARFRMKQNSRPRSCSADVHLATDNTMTRSGVRSDTVCECCPLWLGIVLSEGNGSGSRRLAREKVI